MVPLEFWDTDEMQAALRTRHMGVVVRAYRHHSWHGPRRPLSQETVGRWAVTTQTAISKLELGPPLADLNRLIFWAQLLGIPQRHLWFELPGSVPDPTTEPSQQGKGGLPTLVTASQDLIDQIEPSLRGEGGSLSEPAGRLVLDELQRLRQGLNEFLARMAVMDHTTAPPLRDVARTAITEMGLRWHDGEPRDAMSEPAQTDNEPAPSNRPIYIDIHRAQPARMGDYLLDGDAHFSIDRDVIEYITRALPGGIDTARSTVQASTSFQQRAVRYVAVEGNIRQFLDLALRVPPSTAIHHITQETTRGSRIVYGISDDTAMAHAHRLAADDSEVTISYIRGGVHDPDKLLRAASKTLDLNQPVAVLAFGALNTITNDDTAYRVLAQLMGKMPSGSHLAIAHLASDLLGGAMREPIERYKKMLQRGKVTALALRTAEELARFFEGCDLVEPGIVPVDRWRPDERAPQVGEVGTFIYGAVGRKR